MVLTTLRNRLMLLVRYHVGDLGRWAPACPCDRGVEWPCVVLEGRAKEALTAPDGRRVTVRAIDDAVGEDAADFYCLVQTAPAAFTLEVLGVDERAMPAAVERLGALFGEEADLKVKEVKRFRPARSLKFPQTRSRLNGARPR